jgi:hypothetical protein
VEVLGVDGIILKLILINRMEECGLALSDSRGL